MTRSDYEKLVVAISRARDIANETGALMFPADVIDIVIEEVAHVLAVDNSRFDKKIFVAACAE